MSIRELIYTVIEETYIKFADFTFKQTLGVPMGGSASPDIADLTLSVLEYRYLIKKPEIQYKLLCTCRYIDDIIFIGTTDFMKVAADIYPTSIKLEKTNTTGLTSNFLDLHVQIEPGDGITDTRILKFEQYDKRKDFNFEVLKFPHKFSNVSKHISFNVVTAQLIRAARICSKNETLTEAATDIMQTMLKNKHSQSFVLRAFLSTYLKRKNDFLKFGLMDPHMFLAFTLNMINRIKS